MAKPSMVKTIQRILTEKEQAMLADQQAQQTVQVATKSSGMPASPAQQIMGGVYAQQQHQANLQKLNMKQIQAVWNQMYSKPADVMLVQRQQFADQEAQVQAQIKAKQQQQEYAVIAPKETVQNSESQDYLDAKQLEALEKIYIGLPPKKKVDLSKLGPMVQYYQPMQDYQGGFVDPNYDKQMRPLGKDTTKITEF